jgi:hypothetical protein
MMPISEWDAFSKSNNIEEIYADFQNSLKAGAAPGKGDPNFAASGAMLSTLACYWAFRSLMQQARNAKEAKIELESCLSSLKRLPLDSDISEMMESTIRETFQFYWKKKKEGERELRP